MLGKPSPITPVFSSFSWQPSQATGASSWGPLRPMQLQAHPPPITLLAQLQLHEDRAANPNPGESLRELQRSPPPTPPPTAAGKSPSPLGVARLMPTLQAGVTHQLQQDGRQETSHAGPGLSHTSYPPLPECPPPAQSAPVILCRRDLGGTEPGMFPGSTHTPHLPHFYPAHLRHVRSWFFKRFPGNQAAGFS